MIRRRGLALGGGLAVLAGQLWSQAQTGASKPVVGVLVVGTQAGTQAPLAAFTQSLAELGWHDGRNIDYRFVFADGQTERLPTLAAALVAQRVDVIVTGATVSTRAAQQATRSIPIVMAAGANAVGNGLVASLARPGGNITGVSGQFEDVLGKLVELLHEAAPTARRLAVLLNETSPSHELYWATAQQACATLGLQPLRVVASAPAQLDAAVEQITQQRAQAVLVVQDPMYLNARERLNTLLQASRLPVAHAFREHVAAGGLLSYGNSLVGNFRYAARYVDKILKGAKPADMPVEQPTSFELVINLKTAKSLGLVLPRSLLLRASELIE